jgi:hypothetical protein
MKALIWKEWHENLKWAVVPLLILGGPMALFGPPGLMDFEFLQFLSLLAGLFGAALGFLQVFFESRGDRRALLLHRPIRHSQIFWAKAAAGLALYFLAMGIPFACAVVWTWAQLDAPFNWKMALPWLADILTGVVYYFAGMLAGQRDARWYGSRGLGLATGFLCSFLVWALPDFWQALLTILLFAILVATAARGSFLTGGDYSAEPRLAKTALGLTFIAGLLILGATVKLMIGAWFDADNKYWYTLDRAGRLLVVHRQNNQVSITDLDGKEPPEFQGKHLDRLALKKWEAPLTSPAWAKFHSYRSPGRFLVPYGNETSLSGERWFYVPDYGRLLGYDGQTKKLVGTLGPDGFAPPSADSAHSAEGHFKGELHYPTKPYQVQGPAFLAFSGGVYAADFRQRVVRCLFTPPTGQTVMWSVKWKDEDKKTTLVFLATDKAVHVVDEAGTPVFSAPLAYDRQSYGSLRFGRLDNPDRFVVWYEPSWYLGTGSGKVMPSHLVEYDATGREIARRTVPPTPLPQPSYAQTLFGVITAPAEAAVIVAALEHLWSEARLNGGMEVKSLLFLLVYTATYFIPGVGWDRAPDGGPVLAYAALIALAAVVSGVICLLLARRFAFSRARRIGWLVCGLLFGPAGLLLMIAIQEWPARLACPGCRKLRVVIRDTCEHCGAAHAAPVPDGTEIFDQVGAGQQRATAAC